MDDLQKTVVEFIKQYMPDVISDARKFKAYLCDCMPDERAKRKVMFDAYSEGIHEIIRNATDSKMAMHKCFKILVDDCGFDEKPAAWTVETWACIYGHTDWKVAYDDYNMTDDTASKSETYSHSEKLEALKQRILDSKAAESASSQNSKSNNNSKNFNNLKSKLSIPKYYGGSSVSSYSLGDDDEENEEKENSLLIDDILDLEDAGLDVDELTEMDWSERYDAIEEAGLDPFDYDYGFDD